MSTNQHIDKICCLVIVLVLVLTAVFCNSEKFGVEPVNAQKFAYEDKIFDQSRVHTIDIEIDDWDAFLENCENEEYETCSLVIDNEAYNNAGIRAKGNTSLSRVKEYGNNRYSLKIEFDQYDSSNTYYGLDKLCLNNLIQDNTMMKDYLTYQMMDAFGADAPLCSYVYLTVNGEDWGLYLAVEAVEDSFLERNYGDLTGELYKPDSQTMGGGRGNGREFDMEKFEEERENTDNSSDNEKNNAEDNPNNNDKAADTSDFDSDTSISKGMGETGNISKGSDGNDADTVVNGSGMSGGQGRNNGGSGITSDETVSGDSSGTKAEAMSGGVGGGMPGAGVTSGGAMMGGPGGKGGESGGMGGGPGGGMGSDDVCLIYTDDDYDSYTSIFENAKTQVSDADKDRLIASLKSLNENSNIEEVVNVEEVIRYFVVHNFVVNFDSYTGSMIHNYYLYEEDGQMSMIPWDYNLAFGGFVSSSDATALVNYPIDTPVSGGEVDSRPMLAWILNNEEYTQLYHEYFADFIEQFFDSGKLEDMIDTVSSMIAPYVESDPTKFCTYEEFETGIDTLKEFCLLRAESVSGQLEGSIPSTSEGQSEDAAALVDATEITISDMGSMGNGGGGLMEGGPMGAGGNSGAGSGSQTQGRFPQDQSGGQGTESDSGSQTQGQFPQPQSGDQGTENDSGGQPQSGGQGTENDSASQFQQMQPPQGGFASPVSGGAMSMGQMQPPQGGDGAGVVQSASSGQLSWIYLAIAAAVLAAGLLVTKKFKDRI